MIYKCAILVIIVITAIPTIRTQVAEAVAITAFGTCSAERNASVAIVAGILS